MRNAAFAALLVHSLVLLTACTEPEAKQDPPELATANTETTVPSVTDTATSPASPGGTALVPDVEAGTTVVVLLEDGRIAVQTQSIPPGPAVLTVTNGGKTVHNLFVEGEGISRAAGDPIPEGATVTNDVIFKPGTYTFYCPIEQHRQKGEEVTVTIAP